MAKAITKTTVKVTVTNNRVALTVKYVNGQILKTSATPSGDRISFEQPTGMEQIDLKSIFAFTSHEPKGESPSGRFERLAKFFEGTESAQDALAKIKGMK